jgi:hypothetical protein
MRGPRSARTRRRLLQGGIVLGAVVGVAAVVVLLPEAHRKPETFRDVPADVPAPAPKTVAASPALRKVLIGETTQFVQTAVRRHNLGSSWQLVHPNLKQGLTRKQWLTGAIPVVPFPAVGIVDWRVDWSYADDVAADVVLEPERKSGLYRKTFTIEFKRVPAGHPNGHWLVYSWVPNGVSDALVEDEHKAALQGALKNVKGHEGLPAWWVLVPIGFFAAVILLPVGLVLSDRRRLRKAEEAHRAALAERYSSSSRPS